MIARRKIFRVLGASLLGLLALLASGAAVHAQVELLHAEVGNVAPYSFDVVWQTSEETIPSLEVFADAEGTIDVTDQVRIEFFPLSLGDRSSVNNYTERQTRYALQGLVASRNVVIARVSGLEPATDYAVRPLALDELGNHIGVGVEGLLHVATAAENSFVVESRQLALDFAAEQPSLTQGAIARLETPNLSYPLFAVIGDGARASEAYFNLDRLLNAEGTTNASPNGALGLRISLVGADTLEGQMDYNVVYSGGFVTAAAAVVAFEQQTLLGSFAFDTIAGQEVGVPFAVTIRALDVGGSPFPDFEGPVRLSSNLALAAGAGVTPDFVDGVLELRDLKFSQAGQAVLTATDEDSSVSGSSNPFLVAGVTIYHQLTLAASPSQGGTVSGAGEYVEGTVAEIVATPAAQYRFVRWDGFGVANATASRTTVSMTEDRALTALFEVKPIPAENTYDAWVAQLFGDEADPSKIGPQSDHDGDGMSNLLEYAFGGDPIRPDAGDFFPRGGTGPSGYPIFAYARRTSAVDLTYTVQFTSNLEEGWTTFVPPQESLVIAPLRDGIEQVSFPIPTATELAYVRVLVQQTGE